MNYSKFSLVILSLLFVPLAYGTAPKDVTAVRSGPLTVYISDSAEITEIQVSARRLTRAVRGSTVLEGCTVQGPVAKRALAGGGVEFRRQLVHTATQHKIQLTERFRPTATSVRWELELSPGSAPWSTPVETHLRYPVSSGVKFWTAWSDPDPERQRAEWVKHQFWGWQDPLVAMPVRDLKFWYGASRFPYEKLPAGFMRHGALFSVPLATFLEPENDAGFSIVLSPRDTLLDMSMETTAGGDLTFSRLFHRLSGAQPVRFTLDLIVHEADWRGALRWATQEYPDYFNPPNPLADQLAGTGAYSLYEGDLDAEKMRRMAFRTNWKASFDFPYMGMFLPPVDDTRVWTRYAYDAPAGDPDGERAPNGRTSIGNMADYSRRMRGQGFYVLNYFNVSEFGALIRYPAPPRHYQLDADLWRDANDFLYAHLKDAIVRVPSDISPESLKYHRKTKPGGPYYTWADAIVLDCGEPAYADFLINQARRHIEKLPDSSGICIDRMDWIRLYNEERDDGVSWFDGRPARSLLISWNSLLARLGPLMHEAGKVIFCNNHDKRIDVLRYADGIFDEFTYAGAPLNLEAFLTVRKPALGWTAREKDLRPDPDAFFQKYLHLGVYPMAPYPGNDHSLLPGEWVDKQYLDYGPLLDLMRGKKWVLSPHAVEVAAGAAKVNIFQVPGGYVVPVTFGGNTPEVVVTVRGVNAEIATAEVFHPGSASGAPLRFARTGTQLSLTVPLQRGCAMVRLRTAAETTNP
jgi:hypothetical protein